MTTVLIVDDSVVDRKLAAPVLARYIFFPGSGTPAVEMAQTISRRPMARGS